MKAETEIIVNKILQRNSKEVDERLESIKNIINNDSLTNINKFKEIANVLYRDTKGLLENTRTKLNILPWQIEWMKESKAQGKSYAEISRLTGLSLSAVRYHLIPGEREKVSLASKEYRQKLKANPTAWAAFKEYQRKYARALYNKKRENRENSAVAAQSQQVQIQVKTDDENTNTNISTAS